jgi:hypothetical protein
MTLILNNLDYKSFLELIKIETTPCIDGFSKILAKRTFEDETIMASDSNPNKPHLIKFIR